MDSSQLRRTLETYFQGINIGNILATASFDDLKRNPFVLFVHGRDDLSTTISRKLALVRLHNQYGNLLCPIYSVILNPPTPDASENLGDFLPGEYQKWLDGDYNIPALWLYRPSTPPRSGDARSGILELCTDEEEIWIELIKGLSGILPVTLAPVQTSVNPSTDDIDSSRSGTPQSPTSNLGNAQHITASLDESINTESRPNQQPTSVQSRATERHRGSPRRRRPTEPQRPTPTGVAVAEARNELEYGARKRKRPASPALLPTPASSSQDGSFSGLKSTGQALQGPVTLHHSAIPSTVDATPESRIRRADPPNTSNSGINPQQQTQSINTEPGPANPPNRPSRSKRPRN